MTDSFGARQPISVGGVDYDIFRLDAVGDSRIEQLPYTLKILLENLLRHEDGENHLSRRLLMNPEHVGRR